MSVNFLNWHLTLMSFYSSLYVRCILFWGRALDPFRGLSTRQLLLHVWCGKKERKKSLHVGNNA